MSVLAAGGSMSSWSFCWLCINFSHFVIACFLHARTSCFVVFAFAFFSFTWRLSLSIHPFILSFYLYIFFSLCHHISCILFISLFMARCATWTVEWFWWIQSWRRKTFLHGKWKHVLHRPAYSKLSFSFFRLSPASHRSFLLQAEWYSMCPVVSLFHLYMSPVLTVLCCLLSVIILIKLSFGISISPSSPTNS